MPESLEAKQLIKTSQMQIKYLTGYMKTIRSLKYKDYKLAENQLAIKHYKLLIKQHSLLINELTKGLIDPALARTRLKSIMDDTPVYSQQER